MRVYIDTSVFGGFFDREFERDSQLFFGYISTGKLQAVISEMVTNEIGVAPPRVRDLLAKTLGLGADFVHINAEAARLQDAYLQSGILKPTSAGDAMHIALATLARVDVIASWNFKHFLHPYRVRGFNAVNVAYGYGIVTILSPTDLVRTLETSL